MSGARSEECFALRARTHSEKGFWIIAVTMPRRSWSPPGGSCRTARALIRKKQTPGSFEPGVVESSFEESLREARAVGSPEGLGSHVGHRVKRVHWHLRDDVHR